MKKIIILFLITLSMLAPAVAQNNNAINSKITSLLARMPAKDAAQFNQDMNEISAMGEAGLLNMISMLSASGQADNSKLEYAISGFASYATKPGMESLRKMGVRAYRQGLEKLDNKGNKTFILTQLEVFGKDDAVSCLQNHLNDDILCDPSARALVRINSPAANRALLQALSQAKGSCQISLIEALGDSHNKEAASVINTLTSGADKNLSKVALYALASIADPSSEVALAAAANETGFDYETTNAVSSYLLYAQNLRANGQAALSEKIANEILQKSSSDKQIQFRTAALKILVDIQKEKSISTLLKASADGQPEFRAAALKFAAPYITPSTTALWVKQLKESEPEIQIGIINMLGRNRSKDALPEILTLLKSENKSVKLAAIKAAGTIGGEQVLSALLKVMKKGDQQDADAVKNALLVMKGNQVTAKIAKGISGMSAEGQVALIEVLANRAEADKLNAIYPLLKSKNELVRKAAFSSLKQMVTKNSLPKLFSLFNETSDPESLIEIQDAIIASIKDSKEKQYQADLVSKQVDNAPPNKRIYYYKLLAYLGGSNSLKIVSEAFNMGDEQTKKLALNALTYWSDASAANELFKISSDLKNDQYLNEALLGYVRSVSVTSYPGDQKFLLLRKAMSVAKTVAQKDLILKEIEQTKTFPAMVFAGNYLNDPELQQRAGLTIMGIALANKAYYGDIVRDLLNKTILVLKGRDGEFQKESIRKHLLEMPKGDGFVSMFNGKNLDGWKGLVANPIKRAAMDAATLKAEQEKADEEMRNGWKVIDGALVFGGKGNNLASIKRYADVEMLVDWKIFNDGNKKGDAGIYLRGSPQVQIWDTSRVSSGAQVGSGGLYNNKINVSKPLKVADNLLDEWNTFRITMIGEKVTVYLNGELVTDNVILENYWDRTIPIFPEEQIELQAHGSRVAYRDIYIREIDRQKP